MKIKLTVLQVLKGLTLTSFSDSELGHGHVHFGSAYNELDRFRFTWKDSLMT